MTLLGRTASGSVSVGAALLMGMLVAEQPQLAIVFLALVVGLAALQAPTAAWVGGSLVAALTFKGLTTLGALPSIATLLDIPLAWGALAVALVRQRKLPASARLPGYLLAGLGLTIVFSGLLNHSDLPRPPLYLALLGEPLALIAALLVDPPSAPQALGLRRLFVLLLAIQVPVSYAQAATSGLGDPVQGTLLGAGAGAHVVSGVAVLGAIWLLTGRPVRRAYGYPLALLLLPIPLLADAKQVVLALPAMLIVSRWRDLKQVIVRLATVVTMILSLLYLFPAGSTALAFLTRAQQGQSGKAAALELLLEHARRDPASIAIGQGPATTVSRAAFMTTSELLKPGSPLAAVGLRPARNPITAAVEARRLSGGGTSFNSALSSAIGVFGDLGLIGLVVYSSFWVAIALRLRGRHTGEADAALSGVALLALLGVVFDWWEQPPFTVVLAVLVGLALNDARRPRRLAATASLAVEAP